VPYKTRLDMRRALCECLDFFEGALDGRRTALPLERFEELRSVCFEALDRPSAADLKSLREGAGGGRA
jgi:hypothetical protein